MVIECQHGHLARKCQTCDLEQEITDLRTENASLRASIRAACEAIDSLGMIERGGVYHATLEAAMTAGRE